MPWRVALLLSFVFLVFLGVPIPDFHPSTFTLPDSWYIVAINIFMSVSTTHFPSLPSPSPAGGTLSPGSPPEPGLRLSVVPRTLALPTRSQ